MIIFTYSCICPRNKSTTFFYGLHSYDVIKCARLKWNHKLLGKWFHIARQGGEGSVSAHRKVREWEEGR